MGWRLKKKGNKYRIWSTFSDTYITSWLSRKEILIELAERTIIQAKEKVIEEYYKFPSMWTLKDERKIIHDTEREQAYSDWLNSLHKVPEDEYNEFINKEYECIMQELKE